MSDCKSILQGVFRFLDLNDFAVDSLSAENVSSQKRRPYFPVETVKKFLPPLPTAVGVVVRKLAMRFGKEIAKPKMTEQIRSEHPSELRPDIEKLCGFCGRDFFELWGLEGN